MGSHWMICNSCEVENRHQAWLKATSSEWAGLDRRGRPGFAPTTLSVRSSLPAEIDVSTYPTQQTPEEIAHVATTFAGHLSCVC